MKIVVVLPVNENHKKALQAAAPEAEFVYMPASEVTEELLQTVDATIGNIPVDKFKGYENIKGLNTSHFWNNNSKIIKNRLDFLEENSTTDEEREKYQRARRTIEEYEFQ